jgi:mannose-6-phosphate isomerase-like protein (cupin superfamily)
MATSCNCSAGLLSQIETGAVNPSLATMMSIADALRISVGALFTENSANREATPRLMKPEERKTLTTRGGIQFQLLTRGIDVPFEFLLNRFPPGTHDGVDFHSHEGAECAFLIEGELDVQVNGDIYHLTPGDTITFNSGTPHKISNPGKKEAVVIWVDSEPFIFSTK